MRSMHRPQRGTSLIEALVALLVLALGVMGMAAVQTRSLATARTTNLRALAIQAAEDLQDRILANAALRNKPPLANPYLTSWGPPPVSEKDCATTVCDGLQLAAFDLVQWKKDLARSLPGGDGLVFASPTDANQWGILVAWTETRTRNEPLAAATQPDTGVSGANCPSTLTCHLIFIRP